MDKESNEIYSVTTDELLWHIINLRNDYEYKYHSVPRFLKIPEYMVRALLTACTSMKFNDCGYYLEYCFGLIICPTASIKTIGEIEVF